MNLRKISMITVTFNSERTVRDTFESVRKQGYKNLEYIVVDGGSTDNTLRIADEYKDIITSIKSESDNGISDAMNKGIRQATGEIIGIIHSDDMLCDKALEVLASQLEEDIDVYYGDAIMCDDYGQPMHGLTPETDLTKFPYEFCLIHPSTFVTRRAYERYGFYDTSLKCSMDYDFFLRIYLQGVKMKYIKQEFAMIRMGGTNQKFRKQTLDEMCRISIRHGGNPIIANYLKYKKRAKDYLRPVANAFGYKNKRRRSI